MIKFIVYAAIIIIALFVFVLIGSCMLWVIIKLLRFMFPQRFATSGKRGKDDK